MSIFLLEIGFPKTIHTYNEHEQRGLWYIHPAVRRSKLIDGRKID